VTCPKSLTNFITYYCIKYTSQRAGFELTTLAVKGTDRNNSTIMIMTVPQKLVLDTTLCDKVCQWLAAGCGFLQAHRFPPPIKLTTTNNWNIVESGTKHHNSSLPLDNTDCIKDHDIVVCPYMFIFVIQSNNTPTPNTSFYNIFIQIS
jgi:hypothetical protein